MSAPHAHKTALVTGACGGLGRAIAEAFLFEGANVVVCDIKDELINDFKEQVSPAYPECTLVLKCDITNDKALDDMFAQVEKTFGKLDYVINSAGMMDRFDAIGDLERSMWDKVMALNLTAPAEVTKRAVNMWLKAGTKGAIVNVGSIASIRGFAAGVAYTVSKHGLAGLTKNTAAFYGPKAGIRCNAVLPGPMNTNIASNIQTTGINMEGMGHMRKTYSEELLPYVEIEKVAKLVTYLCSDAADILNGVCMAADGAATAN